MSFARRSIATAIALVAASTAGSAWAQQGAGIALDQYEHPVAGDAFMAVPAPWVGGHLMPRGMITFDYAKDPLVLVDDSDERVAELVTSQIFLHLGASLALWSRLGVSVDFPLAVSQSGGDDFGGLASASSAAAGDLRIGLRGSLFGEFYDPFQIGVGAYLYVPTGPADGYTSDGTVYGQPHLLLGGRLPYLVWSAKAGAFVRGSDNNPHQFTYGAGIAALLFEDRFQVGPEIYGAVAFEDKPLNDTISRGSTVNTEALLGAQYRFLDKMFVLGAAGGPGLSTGVGTPQFRVLARLGFDPLPDKEEPAPPPPDRDGDGIIDAEDACPDTPGVSDPDPARNGCPPDRDKDGIIDVEDACPDEPGPRSDDPDKNGCPLPGDRDGDGIIDVEDACPDTPGVKSDDPKKNGCPPDRDGDGIIDAEDACPDTPGVKSDDPKKNGCPSDRDGDGIIDSEDACPDTPGVKSDDPKKNGCPAKVVITEKEILILQKVEFDFDKATIKPVSDSLLDEVAETLIKHPEIEKLEVQGHTDNKGNAFYNQRLSQQRADAVRAALIKRGVQAERMTSKGYGSKQPVASNDTEEGRADNRRVQFRIDKRSPKKK